jgi:flagellar assembly protein FliH
MSSRINVPINKGNRNLKVKSKTSGKSVMEESNEEVMKKQNEAHYRKGYEDGQLQVKKELENIYTQKLLEKFNELHLLFSDFDGKIGEYGAVFEEIVVQLSLDISEKIIRREVEKKTIITQILKESLTKVIGANEVFVRLNPEDYQQINNDSSEIFREGTYAKMKFEPDERIEKGGCFVESEIGNVDSRITTQIGEIRKQLEATYNDENE